MTEKKGPVQIELKPEQQIEGSKEIMPTQVKGITVTIGGRAIRLVYDMRVQNAVETELEMDFNEFNDKLNKSKRCTGLIVSALRLMGNEGLRQSGQEPDLTDDWLMDHMAPIYTQSYRVAVIGAIAKGWFSETDNSYNEEQDETLIELRKKNETTG